nr:CNT_HP1_G0042540.mRNA.1.CDS.1 [Saccharomyces cerevisiae]
MWATTTPLEICSNHSPVSAEMFYCVEQPLSASTGMRPIAALDGPTSSGDSDLASAFQLNSYLLLNCR